MDIWPKKKVIFFPSVAGDGSRKKIIYFYSFQNLFSKSTQSIE